MLMQMRMRTSDVDGSDVDANADTGADFDVDALDCDLFSRGTGTPVSKGFVTKEIISIIKGVKDTGKLVALEICEINPLLDNKGNQMAESSFEIISSVFS